MCAGQTRIEPILQVYNVLNVSPVLNVGIDRRTAVAAAGAGVLALGLPRASEEQAVQLTAQERANIKVIDAFIAAWNAKDAATVMSFFSEDARFAVGQIGRTPPFRKPDFRGLISSATRITMTLAAGTTWARGPVVTHERMDDIVTPQRTIGGKYIAVFTLRGGKIVDFIDFAFE